MKSRSAKKAASVSPKPNLEKAKVGKNKNQAMQAGKKGKLNKNKAVLIKNIVAKNEIVNVKTKKPVTNGIEKGKNSPIVQNGKKAKNKKKPVKQVKKPMIDVESDDEPVIAKKSKLQTPVGKMAKKKQGKQKKVIVAADSDDDDDDDDDNDIPQSPEEKLGLGIEKVLERRSRGETLFNKKHTKLVEDAQKSFLHNTNVTNAVNALLSYVKKSPEENKDILGGKIKFLLTINFIKSPQPKYAFHRMRLPNSLHTSEDDACLFVADLKGKRQDPEDTIEHYKEVLKLNNITCINEIIPLRKLTSEYSQYEQKRKLANRFEYFLVEGKIAHRINQSFRKCFSKRKAPIPLKFDESALKYKIEEALNKTVLKTTTKGLTAATEFGHNKLKPAQLVENINTIANRLADVHLYAGGSNNIRSIQIKTAKSQAFPVFISNLLPNEVETPKPLPKAKKQPVTGELTTVKGLVKVFPDGTVRQVDEDDTSDSEVASADESGDFSMFLNSSEVDSDNENDANDDGDDNEAENEIKSILAGFKKENEVESDSSDEDDIEEAEQEVLLELRKQQDEVAKKAGGKKVKRKAPAKGGKPNKGASPIAKGASPKAKGVAPKAKGPAPKAKGPAPKAKGLAPNAKGPAPKAKGAKPVGKQGKAKPKQTVEKSANLKGKVQAKPQSDKTNKHPQNKGKQNQSPKNKPKFEKSTNSPKNTNVKGKGKQRYFNAKKK